jgi:hypothetical protein
MKTKPEDALAAAKRKARRKNQIALEESIPNVKCAKCGIKLPYNNPYKHFNSCF